MKTDRRGFLRALVASLAASAVAQAVRPTAAVASEIMNRFRRLEPPAAATLGGAPASRMRLRYLHETGSEGSALCEVQELESVRDSVAFWA